MAYTHTHFPFILGRLSTVAFEDNFYALEGVECTPMLHTLNISKNWQVLLSKPSLKVYDFCLGIEFAYCYILRRALIGHGGREAVA